MSPNNQHAARLREMIDDLACFGLDADGAAALLAGAEALEILKQIIEDLPTKRDWLDPVLEKRAHAALARLEGK